MGDAIDAVMQFKGAAGKNTTLEKLQVSQDLYDELMRECAPLTPAQYFGMKIEVLPDEEPEGPALH